MWFNNLFGRNRITEEAQVEASKKRPVSAMIQSFIGLQPKKDWQYNDQAQEGYIDNSDVFSCINKHIEAHRSLRWVVYEEQPQANGKKIKEVENPNDPLVRILRRPNQLQSWGQFVGTTFGYKLISGNSYIHRVGPGGKRPPFELWNLFPPFTYVIPGNKATPVKGYKLDDGKPDDTVELLPDRNDDLGFPMQQVLHIKTFNPLDPYYGLSPIKACGYNIDKLNLAARHNLSLLLNGGRISGAFIADEVDLTDDQIKDLRKEIANNYSGPNNSGKILLLYGGLDWKEMGIKPKDGDWIESNKQDTRKICSVYNCPPELIGDHQNKTYGTPKEARKAFMLEAIMPAADEFRDELNRWLTPLFDKKYYIDYDKDQIEVIKDERTTIWMNVDRAVVDGWITANEGRRMVGFEDHPDPFANQLRKPEPKGPFKPSNRPDDPSTDPNNNINR